MGRLVVILAATAFFCGVVIHYCPSVMNHALYVGNLSVSWIVLIAIGFAYMGKRMVGGK